MTSRTDRMTPTVSVVMPCLNAAATLAASVASALDQTMEDIELIVVDNGSSDHTVSIVEAIGDPRVRLLRQPARGVSAARNLGIDAARSGLIAFLDSDDTWDPDCLAKLLAALDAHPDAVLAYCGWRNLGLRGGRGDPFVPPDYERPDKIALLLGGCRWPIHAALTRTRAVRDAGGFDTRFAYAEDFGLWLRVATVAPIVRVPEVLAFYHHHGGPRATADPVRAARQLHAAQRNFLQGHRDIARKLGRRQVRHAVEGELLRRAMQAYWARDLDSAHAIFRMVMRTGYFAPNELHHILLALLPRHVFRIVVARFSNIGDADRATGA